MMAKWRLPNPMARLRSQKGVALLIALIAMTLMTFIAVEVSYDTSVEYIVAQSQVHRVQAYYAAKSGVELSLLRIMLYKQIMVSVGESLGAAKNMLDPIWNFPFMWPPVVPKDSKVTEVDQDMLKESVADSLMQNEQYTTVISPEGNKLDINDLGSDVKSIKQGMINQVLRIFQSEIEHNEEFARKWSGYRFETLVNNIADYIDSDTESLNGGDESSLYQDLDEKDIQMPPNRPLRTLDELHQVAGMTDEFYDLLAPKVTVYGTKGTNVNYAEADTLLALDPTMTQEAVDRVIARRTDPKLGGPFKNDDDFFGFIKQFGVNVQSIQNAKINLLYDMEFNFRITSTGIAGNVKREITVVTYDYANLAQRLAQLMSQDQQSQAGQNATPPPNTPTQGQPPGQNAPPGQTGNNQPKMQAEKGRPTIVYWEEN